VSQTIDLFGTADLSDIWL